RRGRRSPSAGGVSRTRVVCVGDLMTDVVAHASAPLADGSDTRARVRVLGGGAAANTAAWLAAQGHPAAYVGRVGDDPMGRAAARAALERASSAGLTVSVDPASAAPLRAVGPSEVLGWLDGVRLLLPNQEEACLLAGVDDPLRAGALLAARFSEVVVTLGAG